MARPEKMGLDYFPHDVNLMSDIKIALLLDHCGAQGVVLYLLLLEWIYQYEGYYLLWDDYRLVQLSRTTGFDKDVIRAALCEMLQLNLFDGQVYRNHSVLTSRGVQRRYLLAVQERAKRKASRGARLRLCRDYWVADGEELDALRPYIAFTDEEAAFVDDKPAFVDDKLPKVKERKGKEKKEDQSRVKESAQDRTPARAPQEPSSAPSPAAGPTPSDPFSIDLPPEDYAALCAQFGQRAVDAKLAHLTSWAAETATRVNAPAAMLRSWLLQDLPRNAPYPLLQSRDEPHENDFWAKPLTPEEQAEFGRSMRIREADGQERKARRAELLQAGVYTLYVDGILQREQARVDELRAAGEENPWALVRQEKDAKSYRQK